jgi:hypothetical protein
MAWIVPKFVFNSTTFVPTYPPKGKVPLDGQRAERHDSLTSSGLRQSVTERIDRVLTLNFPNIPESDLSSWDTFLSWALAAGQFQYYPDSTQMSFYTYQLEDTEGVPEWVGFQLYKLTIRLRRVVAAQIGS